MKKLCAFFISLAITIPIAAYAGCPGGCGDSNGTRPLSPFEVDSQIVGTSKAPAQKSVALKHRITATVLGASAPPKKIRLSEPQVVKIPELPQVVVLSNRDLNRIVCSSGEFQVQGIVSSKEKGIDVAILEDRRNAFVKLPVTEIDSPAGRSVKYLTEPFELYALCGESVYTLIVKPQNTSAQTVILQGSSEKESLKKNLDLFKGQREVERVCSLAKMAFLDDIPASFKQKMLPQKPLDIFIDLKIVPYREILVKGIGLRLREFFLYPRASNLHLDPEDFARKEFFKGEPKGIFLSTLSPSPGEPARLFVVESVVKPFVPKFFPFGGFHEP